MSQIREFQEFITRCNPKTISFLSENQDEFNIADPCVLQLSFTSMLIHENPNVIYLTGGASSMRIDRVKYVQFSETPTPIGFLIKIVCDYCGSRVGVATYTLIAS